MASTYLSRTPSGGNYKIATFSAWVKRSKISSGEQHLISFRSNDTYQFNIKFKSDDTIRLTDYAGSTNMQIDTNRKFRDSSAWYHIVASFDSTQSTASDRAKLWINGVQETSFSTATYPSLNGSMQINGNISSNLVGAYSSSNYYFDGLMSHVHWIDGTQYQASDFGSTDSTTGEWKINTSPSVTYGTNGFFILKDGNSVTDQSGNGNNFTVGGGTLTQTADCPSNVFATLNKLTLAGSQFTLRYGNNSTYGVPSSAWRYLTGTLGASSGKYYWEMKFDNTYGSDPRNILVGILDFDQAEQTASNGKFPGNSRGYAIDLNDGKTMNNTTSRTSGATYSSQFSTGDILGVAMDLDNSKLYFAKNGTWQNSSDPTNGTNPAFTITSGYTYTAAISSYYNQDEVTFNFGNGYFGVTQVSSAGTNASNNGIFEYDVPTGYTALSTKGLNE
jgi:hypothetical protein